MAGRKERRKKSKAAKFKKKKQQRKLLQRAGGKGGVVVTAVILPDDSPSLQPDQVPSSVLPAQAENPSSLQKVQAHFDFNPDGLPRLVQREDTDSMSVSSMDLAAFGPADQFGDRFFVDIPTDVLNSLSSSGQEHLVESGNKVDTDNSMEEGKSSSNCKGLKDYSTRTRCVKVDEMPLEEMDAVLKQVNEALLRVHGHARYAQKDLFLEEKEVFVTLPTSTGDAGLPDLARRVCLESSGLQKPPGRTIIQWKEGNSKDKAKKGKQYAVVPDSAVSEKNDLEAKQRPSRNKCSRTSDGSTLVLTKPPPISEAVNIEVLADRLFTDGRIPLLSLAERFDNVIIHKMRYVEDRHYYEIMTLSGDVVPVYAEWAENPSRSGLNPVYTAYLRVDKNKNEFRILWSGKRPSPAGSDEVVARNDAGGYEIKNPQQRSSWCCQAKALHCVLEAAILETPREDPAHMMYVKLLDVVKKLNSKVSDGEYISAVTRACQQLKIDEHKTLRFDLFRNKGKASFDTESMGPNHEAWSIPVFAKLQVKPDPNKNGVDKVPHYVGFYKGQVFEPSFGHSLPWSKENLDIICLPWGEYDGLAKSCRIVLKKRSV